jgi:WD40 repeat protein
MEHEGIRREIGYTLLTLPLSSSAFRELLMKPQALLTFGAAIAALFPAFTPPMIHGASLYVSSGFSNQVFRIDAESGESFGVFAAGGGLDVPRAMAFGPDGNFYVASAGSDAVLRFNGTTGEFIDVFASDGGLDGPTGLAFGPNNSLLVCSTLNDRIIRYDASSGSYVGDFASGGALSNPQGITFGPDGNLYVLNLRSHDVLRFNGVSGAAMGTFASHVQLGLARGLDFSPDGDLYVSGGSPNWVFRFEGENGQFVSHDFYGRAECVGVGLAFGDGGYYFVSENGSLREGISKVNAATRAFQFNFGDVIWPSDILYGPDPVPEPGTRIAAAICVAVIGSSRRREGRRTG